MADQYCVRCRKSAGKGHKYCTNCGAPLINGCTNDGGPLGEPCKKVNGEMDAYCADCGAPTVFMMSGLVKPDLPAANFYRRTELDELRHFEYRFFND